EAIENGPLTITATLEGHRATASWPGPLAIAQKFPITADLLRDQLGRLGDTPFELGRLDAPNLPPVMIPKSVLNDLRRRLVASLRADRAGHHANHQAHRGRPAQAPRRVPARRDPHPQSRRRDLLPRALPTPAADRRLRAERQQRAHGATHGREQRAAAGAQL